MSDLLTIELSYNNYHLLFPRIIISILIILGIVLLITNIIKRVKNGNLTSFSFTFFVDNYDKVKLFGTAVLLIVYAGTLEIIGFIPASVLFMFLVTLLYIGNIRKKSIMISVSNSLATTIIVWYVFGQLFDITLP
ncbi:tripartite tricarboxylate transporter TctB family protein [Alteribacillus bidgolensis]|uniref:Tripartite tricarboxylate transporter TctB family protein n=1 Tax=Alteribacillus bidgolensis TaxID=930129 RepID=A0A1G8K6J9_9BACI|nr:tripartite tricarboxylate transporter TctB family protein [Alteribacillus bidgolensis]SDI39023.1 Tripartite tricarboxylate transporter TctB family protein [Alteribacillus bidgolensis]